MGSDPRHGYSPQEILGPLNKVERENAPKFLFAEGNLSLLKVSPRVSIVGTRKPSALGVKRAAKLARDLSSHGVVVVSGLAKGIDTAAHTATLDAGGKTIAVLGTPLSAVYPKENAALQRRLMTEHLVLSQFPEGYPIQPSNFPRRNRVMALITDATVIVEAAEQSGAISQGWEALRLGRRLFIMRSVAESEGLKWPAEMQRYGAEVLAETDDLLEALPLGIGDALAAAF